MGSRAAGTPAGRKRARAAAPGPASRGRAGPAAGRPGDGAGRSRGCVTPASLAAAVPRARYRLLRESCPPLLANRLRRGRRWPRLTYVYSDQTAVLGPLATYAEPHAYDLCEAHSERLSAPRGWEVLRLAPDPDAFGPSSDDLLALADAVREAARPAPRRQRMPASGPCPPGRSREVGRRGHLRVLPTPEA